jgi:hypothetical protein
MLGRIYAGAYFYAGPQFNWLELLPCHAGGRGFESRQNRISSRRCLGVSDPICVLVSRTISAANTQSPHLVPKSCSLKSEAISRSTFSGYPAGRVAQSIDNHAPLSFPER